MKYPTGEIVEVGDLIEFGTRHTRYLITSVDEMSNPEVIYSGEVQFSKDSTQLMNLISKYPSNKEEEDSPFFVDANNITFCRPETLDSYALKISPESVAGFGLVSDDIAPSGKEILRAALILEEAGYTHDVDKLELLS